MKSKVCVQDQGKSLTSGDLQEKTKSCWTLVSSFVKWENSTQTAHLKGLLCTLMR